MIVLSLFNEILVKFTNIVGMIADQNFFDMFYILSYGFGYGKDRSFSGPNIRLRPKVKITPTVQHCVSPISMPS